jgi:hypothetical protein
MDRIPVPSGPWPLGIDSLADPIYISDRSVQWSVNTLNRGGIYQTRPGFSILYDSTNAGYPRGITVFTPQNQESYIVKAVGTTIRVNPYPFLSTGWTTLPNITLDNSPNPVYFETCIYGNITNSDGTSTLIPSKPVLIIQTGVGKAAYWDGATSRQLETFEVPIGTHMKWSGNRLWVANGPNLHASNLLEPINFSEEQDLESGGFFTLPGNVTGLGTTANFQSLLVFTDSTVSSIASTILDRTQWANTTSFQQVILSDIGCVAARSIINQYGMTWWYSQGGLVNLDETLLAQRTSKLHYKDEAMARSKNNMNSDISGIATGRFGNFLMVSVPSGHLYNAHTWVMDEAIIESGDGSSPAAWSSNWTGIKPVQWVTAYIHGRSRVFCLSADFFTGTTTLVSNVWEAFIEDRYDFGVTSLGVATVQNIYCSVETKYLSDAVTYKKYESINMMLSECEGSFNIKAYYSPRHGGYKLVLDKDIVADVDSLNYVDVINNLITTRIRQNRFLRTNSDTPEDADTDKGVENPDATRNKDKGFFVRIDWTGAMALDQLVLYMRPVTDNPKGKVEEDEVTDRYVTADGKSFELTTNPLTRSFFGGRQTTFVKSVSARGIDVVYNSI